ncbi:MAG: S1 RNA-binding domain-containing protein [Clostridium sp.]|nr:S1 RNA-binding domain-containing protein [Clostridium sp.]
MDVVSVGDVVKVRVLSVDVERKKISLSMKNAEEGKKGK